MTRLSRDEVREATQKELLQRTNKPRFCYMGYAPPLCIGDQYEAAKTKLKNRLGFMSVPFPKKGRNPDSFFSTSVPLCVGDIFTGSFPTRKKYEEVSKIPFRPIGRADDALLGRIVYVGNPELVIMKREKLDQNKTVGAFIPPSSSTGKLFQECFQYIPSNSSKTHDTDRTKQTITSSRPAFRVPTRSSSLPVLSSTHDFQNHHRTPSPSESRGKRVAVETSKPPFRPGGAKRLEPRYPEYVPPMEEEVVNLIKDNKTRIAWKIGSPNLVTSPNPSIVNMNLLRD